MPKYKNHKTETYEKFLSDEFNNNYGLTEEQLAKYFIDSGTYVVGQYGLTYENMLDTYIPKLKELLNGGYTFFLLYAITEGGGAGNWINHYATDTADNGLDCLIDDCNYLNSLTKDSPFCKSAPEVLDWTEYVDDVAGSSDKFWAEVGETTIAALWCPSTMAGNSWVWGTQWTLANQGQAPKCYYGNPYDTFIKMVLDMGGTLDFEGDGTGENKPTTGSGNNGGGTSNGGGNTTEIDNTLEDKNDNTNNSVSDSITDSINKITKEIKGKLTNYLYSNNQDKSEHSNKNFIVSRMYNNIVKIKETGFFNKFLNNQVNGINDIEEDNTDDKDDNKGSGTNDNISSVGGGGSDGDGGQTETDTETETDTDTENYSKPKLSSKYYVNTAYGGLNECVFIQSDYTYGSVLPDCTGYAWGRSYETMGRNPKLPVSGAGKWYDETDLPKGQTPKKGAIISYRNDSWGHVVFVEDIDEGKSITISQSDLYGNDPYGYTTRQLDWNATFGGGLILNGFIYPLEG